MEAQEATAEIKQKTQPEDEKWELRLYVAGVTPKSVEAF